MFIYLFDNYYSRGFRRNNNVYYKNVYINVETNNTAAAQNVYLFIHFTFLAIRCNILLVRVRVCTV